MSKPIRLPKHRPPTMPGEMLAVEFLEPLGMTITAFAAHIGVRRDRLSEIIHGHRRVTPDTALRFGRALGTSAQFWLDLQQSTDLWEVMHAPETANIDKIKPLCA